MIDREKVIKGLKQMLSDYERMEQIKVNQKNHTLLYHKAMVEDALAMLKEQEAVEPRRIDGKRNHFIKCGNCNYDLLTGYLFCPHCGKAVKWDG